MSLPLKLEETLPLMQMEAEISPYLYLKCELVLLIRQHDTLLIGY